MCIIYRRVCIYKACVSVAMASSIELPFLDELLENLTRELMEFTDEGGL